MTLLKSLALPLGTPAIDFHLRCVDGEMMALDDFEDSDVLVIIFMCNHCPYVKAVIDRFIELQGEYEPDTVRLVGINANDGDQYPDDSFEAMQEWAEEKELNFPYLHDATQKVAKAYKAQCTPDIYVFDKRRNLVYHGRLDDNWQEPKKVKRRDLKEAIDAVIAKKPVDAAQHPSMGCSIKWKN